MSLVIRCLDTKTTLMSWGSHRGGRRGSRRRPQRGDEEPEKGNSTGTSPNESPRRIRCDLEGWLFPFRSISFESCRRRGRSTFYLVPSLTFYRGFYAWYIHIGIPSTIICGNAFRENNRFRYPSSYPSNKGLFNNSVVLSLSWATLPPALKTNTHHLSTLLHLLHKHTTTFSVTIFLTMTTGMLQVGVKSRSVSLPTLNECIGYHADIAFGIRPAVPAICQPEPPCYQRPVHH